MLKWDKRPDMVVHKDDPYNAEPPRRALAGRWITSSDSFYSRNHGPIPQVDPQAWRLTVDGLVDRQLMLSLKELRAEFPEREQVATLQCAGNRRSGLMEVRDIPGEEPWGPGATSTATWTGVSLADVLRAAGLHSEAGHVAFLGPDVSQLADPPQPFGGSIPVGKALGEEVLLAWAMNGQPLPAVHGGPVRVVVPGWIGARSVKWVERVTAQTAPSENHFQAVAYRLLPAEFDPKQAGPGDGLSLGAIAVNADILSPDEGETLLPGDNVVTGYAFAGDDRGIARVDVSIDGGATWRQAELEEQISPWAWRHWRARLELGAGEVEIIARAWDTSAAVQPESAVHMWNPKGYVNNSWARVRVTVQT